MKLVLTYLPFFVLISAVLGDSGRADRAAQVRTSGLTGVCLWRQHWNTPPSREPIPNLTVRVYRDTGDSVVATTTSDTNGRFNVTLAPGRYRFVPQRPLLPPGSIQWNLPDPVTIEIPRGKVVEAVFIHECYSQTACD